MKCGERVEMTGVVSEQLPNAMFRVILNDSRRSSVTVHVASRDAEVNSASLSGEAAERPRGQSSLLRVRVGDEVVVELSPYDTARGRILRKVSP